jgi:hypothetical protein
MDHTAVINDRTYAVGVLIGGLAGRVPAGCPSKILSLSAARGPQKGIAVERSCDLVAPLTQESPTISRAVSPRRKHSGDDHGMWKAYSLLLPVKNWRYPEPQYPVPVETAAPATHAPPLAKLPAGAMPHIRAILQQITIS